MSFRLLKNLFNMNGSVTKYWSELSSLPDKVLGIRKVTHRHLHLSGHLYWRLLGFEYEMITIPVAFLEFIWPDFSWKLAKKPNTKGCHICVDGITGDVVGVNFWGFQLLGWYWKCGIK